MKKGNTQNIIIGGLAVLVILLAITNLLTVNWTIALSNDKIKSNDNESANNNEDITCSEDEVKKDEKEKDETLIENALLPSCEKNKIDYFVNAKNEVVSVSIFTYDEVISIPDIEVYNVYSNQKISSSELLEIFEITNSEFQIQLKTQYLAFFDSDNEGYINGLNEYSKNNSSFDVNAEMKNISEVREQIENTIYNVTDYNMYINSDGNIEFIMDNNLWVRKRELVSWREIGSENYTKIVIK